MSLMRIFNRMAYAYVTRYLSTSPVGSILPEDAEHEEARRMFTRLAPFLTERKSKTVLPSLSGVITDLWSRFEPVRFFIMYIYLN